MKASDQLCTIVAMQPSFRFIDVRSWRRYLFEDRTPSEAAPDLVLYLKEVARAFLDRTDLLPDAATRTHLDNWYESSDGQQTLKSVFERLWSDMRAWAPRAMPAHDARHAMVKVPASGLEYVVAESTRGWERLGLLGTVLHDYGRWAEERIWGGPQHSLVHARLSFLLGSELLDGVDMPPQARNQILLSAIRHTSGADEDDPMPLKIVVSADREQLVGSEIVLRLVHHIPMPNGDLSSFCMSKGARSVLDRLFHFASTRIPGPLYSRSAHMERLVDVLIDVILLSEDIHASRLRFEALQGRKPANLLGAPDFSWESRWRSAQELHVGESDAHIAVERLLSSSNVAPDPRFVSGALAKLPNPDDRQYERVARALSYADRKRIDEDARQLAALHSIAAHSGDGLMSALAARLIEFCGPTSLDSDHLATSPETATGFSRP